MAGGRRRGRVGAGFGGLCTVSHPFGLSPSPWRGQGENGFVFASRLGPGKISKVKEDLS